MTGCSGQEKEASYKYIIREQMLCASAKSEAKFSLHQLQPSPLPVLLISKLLIRESEQVEEGRAGGIEEGHKGLERP